MSAFKDITGQRFGRLTAVKVVGKYVRGKNTSMIWECVCDCGNIKNVRKNMLGVHVNSCGCLRLDTAKMRGRNNKGKMGLPFGIAAKNKLFDHYKRAAECRGLGFELSLMEFEDLTKKNCFYCGIEPRQQTGDKGMNGKYVYNGIDRVDNNLGYTTSNCVPCCETCNRAKRVMSVDEFYSWIDRVYKHRKPKQLLNYPMVYTDLTDGFFLEQG